MTSHLLKLKTKAGAAQQLEAAKAAAQAQAGSGQKDERFWKPTWDAEKQTGSAVIRLLPSPEEDHIDWAKIYAHSFKGPTGKWYIENCLTSIGKDDPVVELCSRLWNSGIESDKKPARDMKRKISYIMNVLVVKDPSNPQAEGKVFLMKIGQQLFDIIKDAMDPKDATEDKIPVFNPWLGANLKIKMIPKDVNGSTVQSYERSTFTSPEAIADDDDEIIAICEKAHKLSEFDSEGNFKSYEELKRKMFEVLGPTVGSGVATVIGWEGKAESNEKPAVATRTAPEAQARPPVTFDDDIPDSVTEAPAKVTEQPKASDDDELMNILYG